MPSPWEICTCGHAMFLHDIDDYDHMHPLCCIYGCGCPTSRVRDDSAETPS